MLSQTSALGLTTEELINLYPSLAQASASGVHLILHFDYNKTLVAKDDIGGKGIDEVIQEVLAERIVDTWVPGGQPMTFYRHVSRLIPGDKYDKKVKEARNQVRHHFTEKLQEMNHPRAKEVRELFERVRERTGQYPLFQSFVQLLDVLDRLNVKATVVLRTFGSELVQGMELIEEAVSHAQFTLTGRVQKGEVYLNEGDGRDVDDEGKLIGGNQRCAMDGKVVEIFQKHRFVGIQDDFDSWRDAARDFRSGKPFPFETGSGESTYSLFFDDNVRAGDDEKNIVAPKDLNGAFVLPTEALAQRRLKRVDTIDAVLHDDYFIDAVNEALELLKD